MAPVAGWNLPRGHGEQGTNPVYENVPGWQISTKIVFLLVILITAVNYMDFVNMFHNIHQMDNTNHFP